MVSKLMDTLLTEEQFEKNEGTSELDAAKDNTSVGNSVNTFSVIYNAEK